MSERLPRRRFLGAGIAATGAAVFPGLGTTIAESNPNIALGTSDGFDQYFGPNRVLDIQISMDPEQWDELRHQTRTIQGLIKQRDSGLPYESPFTWFKADATIDGHRFEEIGIRKKGFLGSLDTEKPALKLRLNKFVEGQELPGGFKRLTLNNSRQDPSMIRTQMAYYVFERAGLPAPRTGFARVIVNGQNIQLYVNVEQIEHYVVPRVYGDDTGNLYEGTISDFSEDLRDSFEKKNHVKVNDWRDIDVVATLLELGGVWDYLGKIVDLEQFLTFWAVETLIGHFDGYAGNMNNFQIYRPRYGKFQFIPWGADQVFATSDIPYDDFANPQHVMAHGLLANRLYNDPVWRQRYLDRLRSLLTEIWDESELAARAGVLSRTVRRHSQGIQKTVADHEKHWVTSFIGFRKEEIFTELERPLVEWPGGWRAPVWR